jgi:hypothetical protein
MPKNFVRKTFERWLARQHAAFTHPPYLVLQRKEYFLLRFAGLTPALQCYISTWGSIEIRVMYQRTLWDILTDFDISARRTGTGQYYCGLCTPREMFPSREALWVQHSFAPFLAWTNEHLHTEQWLCLLGRTGVSWAVLKPGVEVHALSRAADFVYACPVVQRHTPGPTLPQRPLSGEGNVPQDAVLTPSHPCISHQPLLEAYGTAPHIHRL